MNRGRSVIGMRILKTALITTLAVCLAGNVAFARAGRTTAHGKRSSLSVPSKKRKASLSAHSRKHVKAHGAAPHASLGERFEGFSDIPLEELPVAEDEDPANP